MAKCRICDSIDGFDEYNLREMYLETREKFNYIQCRKCECLQIAKIPQDLGKYYPDDYYSKKQPKVNDPSKLRNFFNRLRLNATLNREHFATRMVSLLLSKPRLPDSSSFQFTGSEKYCRDIPLNAREDQEVFTEAELKNFAKRAQELNSQGKGDQAAFLFIKQ